MLTVVILLVAGALVCGSVVLGERLWREDLPQLLAHRQPAPPPGRERP